MPSSAEETTVVPALTATAPEEPEQKLSEDMFVSIPVDDVTVAVTEINQSAVAAARMDEARTDAEAMHRLPEGREGLKAFEGPTHFHDLPNKVAQDIYDHAVSEDRARNLTYEFAKAKENYAIQPYVAPPVSPAIAEQTRLEMEAGKKRVAEFEAMQVHRPRPQENTTMTKVFQPEDYSQPPLKTNAAQHAPTRTYRTL